MVRRLQPQELRVKEMLEEEQTLRIGEVVPAVVVLAPQDQTEPGMLVVPEVPAFPCPGLALTLFSLQVAVVALETRVIRAVGLALLGLVQAVTTRRTLAALPPTLALVEVEEEETPSVTVMGVPTELQE